MSPKSRTLSFYDGIGVIVGIIVGSGIFSSPGLALARAGSVGATFLAWIAASILVSLTCQCYFELSCMMPSAGGDYEYLRKTYGDRVAFAFSTYIFIISKPGAYAIMATIFGNYVETLLTGRSILIESAAETTSPLAKTAAIILILFVTLLNCYGLRESVTFQKILTTMKLFLVVLIFITGILYTLYNQDIIYSNLSLTSIPNSSSKISKPSIQSFASAMIACTFSYDGWSDIIYLIEDLKNPYVTLPLVTMTSIAIVTLFYLLANIAYFAVLTPNEIIQSSAIAYQMGDKISMEIPYMKYLPLIFALGVASSIGGAVHGSILSGGKALYAVTRSGRAPAIFSTLNSKGSPYVAFIYQGIWASFLVSLPASSFSTLLNYFGPADWFFYALSSSAVITLRYTQPSWNRPYKIPFYPLPVILVILIASTIIVSAFLTEPLYTSLAFSLIGLSFPLHFILDKYHILPHITVTEDYIIDKDIDDIKHACTHENTNNIISNIDNNCNIETTSLLHTQTKNTIYHT